ncbi:MAG: FG-GAP repeat domain-containing protein [Bacteroidota bacterium]
MQFLTLIFPIIISFFVDQGEPRFEEQIIDPNISIGYGLAIGDVDGDKQPDIILADKKQFVWYRSGDWKRFVILDNITESDNVCIAARDINGDGQVEIAVGAQWNPGETSDTEKSGAVFYLIRPKDPTQLWKPVELHHEPTTHRMKWVKAIDNKYHLIVVPLHGRGNKGGEGEGVKVIAYEMPSDPTNNWKLQTIDESMHLTHNFDVVVDGNEEWIYLGGKEGIKPFYYDGSKWTSPEVGPWMIQGESFGEVRDGLFKNTSFIVGIQPMHGNELVFYKTDDMKRKVLTSDLKQGHAIATGDLLKNGNDQIVVGWREPNSEGKVGVKIFVAQDDKGEKWSDYWIDDNDMATEDLLIADLNGDGRKDIIAAGRATKNLKIYWNLN